MQFWSTFVCFRSFPDFSPDVKIGKVLGSFLFWQRNIPWRPSPRPPHRRVPTALRASPATVPSTIVVVCLFDQPIRQPKAFQRKRRNIKNHSLRGSRRLSGEVLRQFWAPRGAKSKKNEANSGSLGPPWTPQEGPFSAFCFSQLFFDSLFGRPPEILLGGFGGMFELFVSDVQYCLRSPRLMKIILSLERGPHFWGSASSTNKTN